MGLEQVRNELAVLKSAQEMVAKNLNMPEMLCNKILILLWKWWNARNAVNAGDKQLTPTVIARSVRQLVTEIQRKPKLTVACPTTAGCSWKPPPSGILKINVDGAFVQASSTGGWGFICRDHTGDGVLAGAGKSYRLSMML